MLIATLLVTLSATAAAEALAWEKLERGMSPQQVTATVGVPLLRNAARGHETWIYDAGANAQFQSGVLTAWTAPRAALSNARAHAKGTSALVTGNASANTDTDANASASVPAAIVEGPTAAKSTAGPS